ncbi:DUF3618 domain-containing protein [Actinomadura opuntiae]|uniref:DUF3618 domain-containing protein n=1 Tax=Actinomadura sp. OS1-43 TaxID=604315 RepID=UPI00255AB669|nr:DUF3618 domain-containing protein [Actinomadura sp. OS1-43]MDL4816545.1 DUF3618 domain-containing protein [Actinomadura sp. OS1-43]
MTDDIASSDTPEKAAGNHASTPHGASAGAGSDRDSGGSGEARGEQGESPEELQAEVERTREALGDTVEALAAKADVPTRAKQKAEQVKQRAAETVQQRWHQARDAAGDVKVGSVARQVQGQAKEGATRVASKAREVSASQDARTKARRGAIAGGALVAAGLAVVLIRRRRSRNVPAPTKWQRVTQAVPQTTQQAAAQVRDKAADLGTAAQRRIQDSDLPAQVADRGRVAASRLAAQSRRAAADPETPPRLQGAAVTAAVLVVAGWVRRRRAARRSR